MQHTPLDNAGLSFQALRRSFPLLCVVGIVTASLGYGIARKTPPSYEVHFSYMVALQQRDVSSGFRYDGYYALSGTELFSSTLASLITSPENVVRAYNAANIPLTTQDPIGLVQHVQAQKAASQLVQVTVTDPSKDRAESLAQSVQTITKSIVQQYNDSNKDSTQFSITPTASWTGVVRVAAEPVAVIAGVLSVIIAAMIVLFIQALKREEQQ